MDQTAITAAVRRAIREPSPVTVTDAQIAAVTLRGVLVLGLEIKEVDPSFFNKTKVVSSYTHIFAFPSDALSVLNVWDLKTTAAVVAGAADNGSGLVRITTSSAHGFADADIVQLNDVGGTTEANNVWQIDYDTDTHETTEFDLIGSTFANAWTSGGLAYKMPTQYHKIERINLGDISHLGRDKTQWYPREKNIVINHDGFTDDIIVDYEGSPDAITDVPAEYHEYLVSFCAVDLMPMPKPDDPGFQDKVNMIRYHEKMMDKVVVQLRRSLKASTEPTDIPIGIDFDDYM